MPTATAAAAADPAIRRLDAPGPPPYASMAAATRLLQATAAAGGTNPDTLTNITDAWTVITRRPTPNLDPINAALAAATTGTLTPGTLDEIVTQAAHDRATAQVRDDLERHASSALPHRFWAALAGGAADLILDSLRPTFAAAADTIADVARTACLDLDDAQIVKHGNPEQLAARQRLPELFARLDGITAVAVAFAPRGDWALTQTPRSNWGEQLDPRAISTLPAAELWDGSRIHRTPAVGLASSPWLRTRPRLNTVAEQHDALRGWAEMKWTPRPGHDDLNPYTTAGGVHILPLDDDE